MVPGPPDDGDAADIDPAEVDPADIETQLIGVPGPDEPTPPDAATSALGMDHLFGDQQFRDYADEPLISAIPLPAPRVPRSTGTSASTSNSTSASAAPARTREPAGPMSRNQRIALSVAGGVVAVLILVLLFVVGTRIGSTSAVTPLATTSASPSASPSVTPSASPSPTAVAGPASIGQHKWSDLNGGECLDPFTSPFAEMFTVVDCAVAHPAQLVVRGQFAADAASGASSSASPAPGGTPGSSYPGIAALQAQINLLCTAPGVIDLAIAGAYSDIQFQASYPATAAQWDKGDRNYYCFVNRSSGELITGSVAGAAG